MLHLGFCSTDVSAETAVQPEGLREAFCELAMTREARQITLSPEKPYFRVSTLGNAASPTDYPRDSDLII